MLGFEFVDMLAYRMEYGDGDATAIHRWRSENDRSNWFSSTKRHQQLASSPHAWVSAAAGDRPNLHVSLVTRLADMRASTMTCMSSQHTVQPISNVPIWAISFDTLIPRQDVEAYLQMIKPNQLNVMCGPTGTGKSQLVRRLAQYLIKK